MPLRLALAAAVLVILGVVAAHALGVALWGLLH